MLYNKIVDDWKTALKAGSGDKVLLSSIAAEVKNKVISLGLDRNNISDELTTEVLTKMAKQRSDNASVYRQNGAEEMAKNEEGEVAIIERYLPPKMSQDLVAKLIEEAIAELGAKTTKEIGKVMSKISPKIKGAFDGKVAMQLAKDRLTQIEGT